MLLFPTGQNPLLLPSVESVWPQPPSPYIRSSPTSVEGVFYHELLDLLPVLQILAVEAGTAAFDGGGDDQGIEEGEAVAALNVEGSLVEGNRRGNAEKRLECRLQVGSRPGEVERNLGLPEDCVEALLDNLKADSALPVSTPVRMMASAMGCFRSSEASSW